MAIEQGRKYHLLTAIKSVGLNHRKDHMWLCRCDCGSETVVRASNIGTTKSCGCLLLKTKHGMARTRLYRRWVSIKMRCRQTDKAAEDYWYRGIRVCEEWQTFEPFLRWALANGYRDDLEIDRINNDGDYEPGNCRWVTRRINQNNRRNTVLVTAFNETKSAAEWSRDSRCVVIKRHALLERFRRGWVPEIAITTPVLRHRR
jgi:hypothetical protein